MLLVSQGLLWAVVILLGIVVLLLARQIGVLHERIAPIGALAMGGELRQGAPAQQIIASALSGETVKVGAPPTHGRAAMLLFVAPACPVCKTIIPVAVRFAQIEDVELLLVGDGDPHQYRKLADQFGIAPSRFVNSAEVGMAYKVGKVPYAVLIDQAGLISAHGLVNTLEHLESLIISQETGLSSIQQFLTDGAPQKRNAPSDAVSG
ncbi:MAG TPA: methylamine utilization protein MauD [Croceibacterium sp.]|nr:methylamine utilization protein MauD [Croceibacterium sp.]